MGLLVFELGIYSKGLALDVSGLDYMAGGEWLLWRGQCTASFA